MGRILFIVSVLFSIFMLACQPVPQAEDQGAKVTVNVQAPTEEQEAGEATPDSAPVSFKTSDGVEIFGTLYEQEPATEAVILLHMLGKDRTSWDTFAQQLQAEGYRVLAIDLRGHGESTQQGNYELHQERMDTRDFQSMVLDVAAAKNFLKRHGITIHIIGASIGANVALQYAALDPEIQSIVLLSPGEEYHGVRAFEANENYKGRVLFIASDDDVYSYRSTQALSQRAGGDHLFKTLHDAGHGTTMLRTRPSLTDSILTWLKEV